MSEELKSCPFCGSDDVELVEGNLRYVTCNNCCGTGPDCHSGHEATEAWNTRAGEEHANAEWAAGYIFHSPDTGTEILPYHPVESGECTDATDIRLATADVLKAELLSCWEEMANSYREQVERGEECAADTRRLDWLEDMTVGVEYRKEFGWGVYEILDGMLGEAPTLRTAIDAAMECGK